MYIRPGLWEQAFNSLMTAYIFKVFLKVCKYFCEGLRLYLVMSNDLNLIVGFKEKILKYRIFGK